MIYNPLKKKRVLTLITAWHVKMVKNDLGISLLLAHARKEKELMGMVR